MKKYRELILYIIFGAATTGVNWVIYILGVKFFHIPMLHSNAIAWIAAVNFAYITNRIYVFESKVSGWRKISAEYIKFLSGRIFSGILEICLPTFLYTCGMTQSFFGIQGGGAKVVAAVIANIINYVLSKVLIFK